MRNRTPRVVINPDEDGSPDVRNYSLTVELLRAIGRNLVIDLERSTPKKEPSQMLTAYGARLMELTKVRGIASIEVGRFSVTIKRFPAFGWETIQPHIIDILATCFEDPANVQAIDRTVKGEYDYGVLKDFMTS
jgi:hypothetical protein